MKNNGTGNIVVVRRSGNKKEGLHGGSWKIAYADFMTAMMSFFLVMWLVSSSTPEQRHQLAEYFKIPIGVPMAEHGDKDTQSQSIIPGGGEDVVHQNGEVQKAVLQKQEDHFYSGNKTLKHAESKLHDIMKTDARLNKFRSNLRLSLTPNGLLIQITDSQERPMFKVGSWTPETYMVGILEALVPVLNQLPNHIMVTGHTDSLPYAGGDAGYSNWELSVDRANAARRILINHGLEVGKFLQVVGDADSMNQTGTAKDDPVNRRISILVLSEEKEQEIMNEDKLLDSDVTAQKLSVPSSKPGIAPSSKPGTANPQSHPASEIPVQEKTK